MAVNLYKRSVLIGGGADSLDLIDGAGLNDGDFAFVMTSSNISYTYILNATSGATESSPGIITPDTNAGSKRWILQNVSGIASPLTNLLTNTQWIANSGSTAENVGSQLVVSWANSDYDTFTSTAENITSAIYSTAGTQNADTASITIVSGKLYKIVATLTLNSGQAPTLTGTGGVTTTTLSAGANTITFEATAAATILTMTNTAASNYSCTFTLYEITPGYVAADTLAPDGWTKDTTLDVWREHDGSNTKEGSFYALKLTTGASDRSLYAFQGIESKAEHYEKFTGRTVTFGCWIKTSVANHARLGLYDGSTYTYSSYHTGGGSYEWIEFTRAFGTSLTYARAFLHVNVTASDAYFSQPMLVFGSSIGQGNYAPIPGEVIWLQTQQSMTTLTGNTFSDVGATLLNVEAETSGIVGKGVKSLLIYSNVRDSGSAATSCYLLFGPKSDLSNSIVFSPFGKTNDANSYQTEWAQTDTNGDIYYSIDASGAATFDVVNLKINAIQT